MMQVTEPVETFTRTDPESSAALEWVQIGLDALAELPAHMRQQMAFTEQYLRRRKALLETQVPA